MGEDGTPSEHGATLPFTVQHTYKASAVDLGVTPDC